VGRAGVVIAVALALVLTSLGRGTARAAEPLVLVYGDSLVYETQPYAEQLLRDVGHVDYRVMGAAGAATCDWLPGMRADAARLHPAAVVIGFFGNAFSPCMQDAAGKSVRGDEWLARYRAASLEVLSIFHAPDTTVWFATGPISKWADDAHDPWPPRFEAMLREVAASSPRAHVVDSAAAVLWNGHWARWLPCLDGEPCEGGVDTWGRPVNIVRNVFDNTHFCPAPFPRLDRCPVYSSGAMRFAGGMLVPVLQSLGRFDTQRSAWTYWASWSH
jgi:hypothetical protein